MKIFIIVARLCWFAGLLLLWMLPRRSYEWAQQIDPGNPLAAQGGADDNQLLFSILLCAVLAAMQALLWWRSGQRRDKLIAASSLALTFVVWLAWYLR